MTEEFIDKTFPQEILIHYSLRLPPGFSRRRRWPLLVALHGYEGNKDSMLRLAAKIAGDRFVIASLQGPYQFLVRKETNGRSEVRVGFGWLTRYEPEDSIALHHQNVQHVIDEASREYGIDHRRVFLLGFSQSVSLNYRFVFTYPDVIRGVVAICGGIPGDYERREYQRTNTDVLHVAADADEFYDLERVKTFEPALKRRAAGVELRIYKGGHAVPLPAVKHIARWLNERI